MSQPAGGSLMAGAAGCGGQDTGEVPDGGRVRGDGEGRACRPHRVRACRDRRLAPPPGKRESMETKIIDNDVIRLRGAPKDPHDAEDGKERVVATLAWGDDLRVEGKRFEVVRREWDSAKRQYASRTYEGELPKKARFRD